MLQLKPVLALYGLDHLHFRVLRSSSTTRQSAAYASRSLPGAQAALPAPSPLKPTTPSSSRSGGAASAAAKTTKGLGAYMVCWHAPALSFRCNVDPLFWECLFVPGACECAAWAQDENAHEAVQPLTHLMRHWMLKQFRLHAVPAHLMRQVSLCAVAAHLQQPASLRPDPPCDHLRLAGCLLGCMTEAGHQHCPLSAAGSAAAC